MFLAIVSLAAFALASVHASPAWYNASWINIQPGVPMTHEVVHVYFDLPADYAIDMLYTELTVTYASTVDFAAIRFGGDSTSVEDAIVIKDKGTRFAFTLHANGVDMNHWNTAAAAAAHVAVIDIWCPAHTSLARVELSTLYSDSFSHLYPVARPGYTTSRSSAALLTILLMAGFALLFLSFIMFAVVIARRLRQRSHYSCNANAGSSECAMEAVPLAFASSTSMPSTDAEIAAADEAALNAAIALSLQDQRQQQSRRVVTSTAKTSAAVADVVYHSDSDADDGRAAPPLPSGNDNESSTTTLFVPLASYPGGSLPSYRPK